jgi:SAM-dependent methyltransferase
MDAIRKLHNSIKRDFIYNWVQGNQLVLDCGCGRGGDWHKWKSVQARVFAIDPDEESLCEAEKRARELKFNVFFLGKGDIRHAAFAGPFDVVSYNFSIHYIFEDPKTFEDSIKALGVAVKPGGILMGITPEKARIESMVDEYGYFKDKLGNEIAMSQGGRRLLVRLVDGPFYADGGREEPVLDSHILISKLKEVGFEKLVWEPMLSKPNGLVSDLYSKFVFKKISLE